jgi:hypothetical protein
LGSQEGVTDATTAAVDNSRIAARGPPWHASDRKRNRIPKGRHGVDQHSDRGRSQNDGWVQGYRVEVVVSSEKGTTVFPLLASAGTANVKETQSFDARIDDPHESTKDVAADSGYDSNHLAERIEWTEEETGTSHRFLCPEKQTRFQAHLASLDRSAARGVAPQAAGTQEVLYKPPGQRELSSARADSRTHQRVV